MTILVETLTGSLYTLQETTEGIFLTANNVPNPHSEKMPGDEAVKLLSVTPWPPQKGTVLYLTYPTPRKDDMVRIKRTSPVMRVTHL